MKNKTLIAILIVPIFVNVPPRIQIHSNANTNNVQIKAPFRPLERS